MSAKHVEFANDGEVYIAGDFHGVLNPQANFLGTSVGTITANNSDADVDYFIARFLSADQMGGGPSRTQPTWLNYSDFNASNTSSPTIRKERIRDMHAYNDAIAITGSVKDPVAEGARRGGFAHIYDFSGFITPGTRDPANFSGFDVTYLNQPNPPNPPTLPFYGKGVTATEDRLTVAGRNFDTNYNLGGPSLPGGFGFLVSYTY